MQATVNKNTLQGENFTYSLNVYVYLFIFDIYGYKKAEKRHAFPPFVLMLKL